MNCEKCNQEMQKVEADPDGEIPYCPITWHGQPSWIVARAIGEHYECPGECVDTEHLVDEGDQVAVTIALMKRAARLAQPPDGNCYLLTATKVNDTWAVEVKTLMPSAMMPVPAVLDAMLAAGHGAARRIGWRKTPETSLLESLQRLLRLRQVEAPGAVLEDERRLTLKHLAAFDPAFMPAPEAE